MIPTLCAVTTARGMVTVLNIAGRQLAAQTVVITMPLTVVGLNLTVSTVEEATRLSPKIAWPSVVKKR